MTTIALVGSARLPAGGRSVLLRAGGLAALVWALASLHLPGRPGTLCTLRALTGIPCPLCGTTTAAASLGRGDVVTAVRASPFAVLGAALLLLAPLRRPNPTRPGRHLPQPVVLALVLVGAVLSELWQLARFGYL